MTKFRTLLAMIGLALMTTMAAVAPAHAAYKFERDSVTGDKWGNGSAYCAWKSYPTYGVGCFETDGDYIQAGDTRSDGLRIGVQWRTGYGRSGLCVNTHGHEAAITGQWIQVVGHYSCNKNFKENHKIQLRVGTCNGSKVNCGKLSNWRHFSAWSRWIGTSEKQ